jgi:ribosomal protein S18 acetylase RimI-like enzyme
MRTLDFPLRRLRGPDAAAWRALRLRGLREEPGAFGSAWEEEEPHPLPWFAERLERHAVLGAGEATLLATAGLLLETALKHRHKAVLWGVFVAPEARGQGLARLMMRHLIWHAADHGLRDIRLTTSAENRAALALYASLGFVPYGREPRATLVQGRLEEAVMMALHLDASWFSNPRPDAIPGLCPPPPASP